MALEKSAEIYAMYQKGLKLWDEYYSNNRHAIEKEIGCCHTTLRRWLRNPDECKRVSREAFLEYKRRIEYSDGILAEARHYSVLQIKRRYHISTDTLNKIIDRESDSSSSNCVRQFLTMRLV